MIRWIKTHERLALLLGFFLITAVAVFGFGRVEFHNELEREVYTEEFLGYVDESVYSGSVTITAEEMPQWCQELGITGKETVEFADGISGQVGMFADVVYLENHYEVRTWFSGKTLEEAREYYYRLSSPIQLEPVYQPLECRIDVNNIRGVDYDYTTFKGPDAAPEQDPDNPAPVDADDVTVQNETTAP